MGNYTRVIREYSEMSFRCTRGDIDVFRSKQFHPFYEFYFLVSGKVEFINSRTRRRIESNQLAIIPPGEYHHFIVDQGDVSEYERCVMTLSPEFLENLVPKEVFYEKDVLALPEGHRIAEHFRYLKSKIMQWSEADFEHILSSAATDIAFLIKNDADFFTPAMKESSNPLAFEIMRHINENYKKNITLKEIAERFFVSPSTISHVFKADFGVSVKKYITEKRMNEIRALLKTGRKPMELSQEYGFFNYSTFYRSYCKYFGSSPSEFL